VFSLANTPRRPSWDNLAALDSKERGPEDLCERNSGPQEADGLLAYPPAVKNPWRRG
jgi:hypothetical protein